MKGQWQSLQATWERGKTEVVETFAWLAAEDRWQQEVVVGAMVDSLRYLRSLLTGKLA